ncbi:hypothetical protein [Ktedonospora formicarum]|uniref:Uncharacterized protein n=1 Tax=Ktedonospora formicarum TaxID=2778364 RepID=A0A8J3MZ81_9CHLR|nr:hypothetical protein [Ktedonospora formicarum]GHO51508.1 hypothetical protein KSX_96710 [Ktedonospora formicarum]
MQQMIQTEAPDLTEQTPAAPLSRKEQRAAAKLARQQAKEAKRLEKKDKAAASASYDSTKTDPDSFYERAIEWTHRADKIINLVLGYLLAVASVLGFMDVLSNGEVLGHVPFLFYAWLLIMGLGVDFQILLVIGRVPDLARMVDHGIGKWVLIIFNILFLIFLAYVSIIIGAVFTQHRDVPGTIAQAMSVLNINTVNFVYERAALATFLLILMGVDRTMERWRMQMAAGNRQQREQANTAQVSTVEDEQVNATPATQPTQASELAQVIQAMQEMNAQNFAAMQAMNKETLNHFSKVTVEMVRETVERTAATIAIQAPTQVALPAPGETEQGEQSDVSAASQGETDALNLDAITVRGEQETADYGPQIEAMYQKNNEVTLSEIVTELGCSRSTASKWLKRVKPVMA